MVILNILNVALSDYTIGIFYWNKFTIRFNGEAKNLSRGQD